MEMHKVLSICLPQSQVSKDKISSIFQDFLTPSLTRSTLHCFDLLFHTRMLHTSKVNEL